MDGTLVDTEPYWMECEFALAEKYGGTWSHEHGLAVVGGDLIDSATYMREHMGIDRTPQQIVEELLDGVVAAGRAARCPGGPGARELLAALRAQRCARARWSTMSWRRFVEPVRPTPCPTGPSTPWSAATRSSHGKPHPEAYLRAAELLGLAPGETRRHRGLADRRDLGGGRRLPRAGRAEPRRRCRQGSGRVAARVASSASTPCDLAGCTADPSLVRAGIRVAGPTSGVTGSGSGGGSLPNAGQCVLVAAPAARQPGFGCHSPAARAASIARHSASTSRSVARRSCSSGW